jgi:hypothetical protein
MMLLFIRLISGISGGNLPIFYFYFYIDNFLLTIFHNNIAS